MSLKKRYRETIQPKLLKDLSLTNIHEVPKVMKVTINRGLGEAATNAKSLEASVKELAQITGQKVVVTRAKKAIAGFKIARACLLVVPSPCAVIGCMPSSSA
jgi:large subunit ribosomal protein L5